jgi:hypothetical protein
LTLTALDISSASIELLVSTQGYPRGTPIENPALRLDQIDLRSRKPVHELEGTVGLIHLRPMPGRANDVHFGIG